MKHYLTLFFQEDVTVLIHLKLSSTNPNLVHKMLDAFWSVHVLIHIHNYMIQPNNKAFIKRTFIEDLVPTLN